MTWVIAASVWVAVIGLICFRSKGSERSTTYAAIAVGVGTSLNISPLYLLVDEAIGGHNFTDLVANTAIMVGVLFLAQGVVKASGQSGRITRTVLDWPALTVTLAASFTAFFNIETDHSSTRFMVDFGDQVAAGLYSGIQHAYFGIVVLAMAGVCLRQLRTATGMLRAAAIVLLTGSSIQFVTCVDVIVMDVAHVVGNESLLSAGQYIYDYINSAGFILIAAGLVLRPLGQFVSRLRRRRALWKLTKYLTPVWLRARSVQEPGSTGQTPTTMEGNLYRMVVEIRDVDATVSGLELTDQERSSLVEAEQVLLAPHA